MTVDDCYEELGLKPGASDAQVKAAWRKLAARWHPDRNDSPQALLRIQRINQAVEEIRKARAMRGGGGEPAERNDEAVVQHVVHVTLEDVVGGCVRDLRGELVEACGACEGTGLQPQPTRCAACAGAGRVSQPLWFGWLASSTACGACGGHGSVRGGCPACDASGKVSSGRYRCRVEVPAGVRAGDVVDAKARLQGAPARRTVPLRVRVEIAAHEFFSAGRDGTVACVLPVDGFAWMAERWVELPTLHGVQQMRLRRSASKYRIKAAGLPWLPDGSRADCIVDVVPLFPDQLGPDQEAAIDALVASNSGREGTEAASRVAAWRDLVRAWQQRTGTRQPR